jgi:uncharacterized protein YdeI (YjbR/CyaY-like superfamily)
MAILNPQVDLFLLEGCGRCHLYQTPACRALIWNEGLHEMRRICLESGLTEEYKWQHPCYTFNKKNILILGAFKEYFAFNFFKGALLKDDKKLLVSPGENSQSSKQLKFTQVNDVLKNEKLIKRYILEAIEVEKLGKQVVKKTMDQYPIPPELQEKFQEDPSFEAAFYALTPGRQRGYLLFFAQAKQSTTRANRIEKFVDAIFKGKGYQD